MSKERKRFIAIAGPTCSGKTTLARQLANLSPQEMLTISFDEYDKYPNGTAELENLIKSGQVQHWEDPMVFDFQSLKTDLIYLNENRPIILVSNSRESVAAGFGSREMNARNINLFEGILILYDDSIREFFDLSFYLDLPLDEVVKRRIARTPRNSSQPWDRVEYINGPMIQGTEEFVLPQKQYADYVLDGLEPPEKLAQQVLTLIKNLK